MNNISEGNLLSRRHLLSALFLVTFTLGVVWLGLNIGASQQVPSLYVQHVEDEQRAIVPYLSAIRTLPEFDRQVISATNRYGAWVKADVYRADSVRNITINELEQKLVNSPSNRDILMSLSILYQQKGIGDKSREYMDRAREVDPLLP